MLVSVCGVFVGIVLGMGGLHVVVVVVWVGGEAECG